MISQKTLMLSAVFAVLISLPGFASAQVECYRSAECDGSLICMDLKCVESGSEMAMCDEAGLCDGYHEICDDGYCKPDGVACQNPAGHCTVDTYWGSCVCEEGIGTDWMGEEPSDATDEELWAECVDSLVYMCGEEEPDISEYCDDEELEICEDFLHKAHEMEDACYEDGDEPDESGDSDEDGESTDPSEGDRDDVGFWELRDCCEEFEEEMMQDYIDCIMDLEPEDCDGLDECNEIWGDGDPAGDDTNDEDFESDEDGEGGDQDGEEQDSENDQDGADGGESAIEMNTGGTGCSAVPWSGPASLLDLISLI